MLKIAIVVLFIGVLISLTSAFGFLVRDQGKFGSRRTLYALGIRVMLAGSLVLLIWYGLYTGELGLDAPWHRAKAEPTEPSVGTTPHQGYPSRLQYINKDKQAEPDHVDKMPVPRDGLKTKLIGFFEVPAQTSGRDDREHKGAQGYMKTVKAG